MESHMKEGSFFIASSLPFWFDRPKEGDIILFDDNGKKIVKKIVKIENEKFHVSGENKRDSLKFDPIDRGQITGKVIFVF